MNLPLRQDEEGSLGDNATQIKNLIKNDKYFLK